MTCCDHLLGRSLTASPLHFKICANAHVGLSVCVLLSPATSLAGLVLVQSDSLFAVHCVGFFWIFLAGTRLVAVRCAMEHRRGKKLVHLEECQIPVDEQHLLAKL